MKAMAYMDAELYKSAAEGNTDALKTYAESLDLSLTPKKNTILHIHLTSPSKRCTHFVKVALQMCPKLLWQINLNGDTPLQIAARYGHFEIVKLLIEHAKLPNEDLESGVGAVRRMLRMLNVKKDTALHEAARNHHLKVVKLLTHLDPHFEYPANDCDETPLYLAARKGHLYMVIEMLKTCQSLSYLGPKGKTALHAAVLSGNRGMFIFHATTNFFQQGKL